MLEPWRRHVNCLFGLTLSGVPIGAQYRFELYATSCYDSNSTYNCPDTSGGSGDVWNYFTADPNVPQVDRIPLEAVLGWDATLNGNLAEQLQEPSLMGAYEGAGITVLGKGVWIPPGQNAFGTEGCVPGRFPASAECTCSA